MHSQFLLKVINEIVARQTRLYNVVYFYGDPQSTTPVVDTIVEKYRVLHPHAKVIRIGAVDFLGEMFQMITSGRKYMPKCDLYIFEDIGGVAGKEFCEQPLYGILDWMLEHGRQIIVTGTEPVADIPQLAPRICAQISGGISLRVE